MNARFFLLMIAGLMVARAVLMAVMPLTDPSEARYGVLAANMARDGDFMVPRFIYRGEFQSFDGKPPLFFQAGGVAAKVFGRNEFAVRLPSLLAALLTIGAVFYTVRRLSNKRTAVCAAVMCATNGVFYLFSGFCITDMLLVFCITGAICAYMLFAGSEGREKKIYSVAFFACLALGMLTKGPVALVLSGLPIFAYVCVGKRWKELAQHAWVAGPLVFLAIALPWYAKMALSDSNFLEYFFVNENFLRFVRQDYGDRYGGGHETFKGMALIWFVVASLPYLPLALGIGFGGRGRRILGRGDFSRHPVLALSLLGCLCMAGFWSLTSRALLPYLLPAAPLVAMWSAMKFEEWGVLETPWMARLMKWMPLSLCVVALVGLGVATVAGHEKTGNVPKWMYRDVQRLQRETPEYADAGFYFAVSAPYSAEFYLGDAFRNHPLESPKQSVANSGGGFLLMTRRQFTRHLDAPPPRKVVYENPKWIVFAPELKGDEE